MPGGKLAPLQVRWETSMRTISRQALFDDVWTRPLTKIAPELGISDVALRKICDRHNIPSPGRG